ncbi:adenine phosphoribosyltransferase [Microbacterium sp. STN6]|uniref:adenine phosphoribosyltransferase n=1 Tax=Microbacterium sp. STN6 TaxID=2995588 RepID=UPI003A599B25
MLATIPDFPEPGILFRDLAPVFADAPAFRAITDELLERFEGRFDAVAGVEARGFVLAAAAAYASGTGLVIIRKPGKLPGNVLTERYDLEYGSAELQLEPGHLPAGSRVLILDDVLATGGTLAAAAHLTERAGYAVAGFGVVLELEGLGGRGRLGGYETQTLLTV